MIKIQTMVAANGNIFGEVKLKATYDYSSFLHHILVA